MGSISMAVKVRSLKKVTVPRPPYLSIHLTELIVHLTVLLTTLLVPLLVQILSNTVVSRISEDNLENGRQVNRKLNFA